MSAAELPDEKRGPVEDYIRNNPEASVTEVLGRFTLKPSAHADAVAALLDRDVVVEDEETGSYIEDPDFDGSVQAVREHYERARPVYEALATAGDYPTSGFAGNAGWYRYTHLTDVDVLEEGWDAKGRAKTFERDLDDILDGLGTDEDERTVYNIASWKDPKAMYSTAARRWEAEGDEDLWRGGESPLPKYEDIRALGFWVDLDLADKAGRADLTENELETVEAAQQAFIDEVADLYNVQSDEVFGLDSGGGAYIYGPPEAALPIAQQFDDDERRWVLEEFTSRIKTWGSGDEEHFDGAWSRVCDRIEGAEELLDPDFMQNKNRQSKAPMALHKRHDIAVTPLRNRDPETGDVVGPVDYEPTLVSAVDEDVIDRMVAWADRLTALEHVDAVEAVVPQLWAEYAEEQDTWRDILEAWVEAKRAEVEAYEERREAIEERKEEWAEEHDTPRAEKGLYEGAPVVTDQSDVIAAVESIDVREVVERHACDVWNTSNRDHETTFDPSWRSSNSGQSCAIPSGSNTFIDNGCDAGGGPAKAYALGEDIIPGGETAAAVSVGEVWGETLDAMRADGYNIPVYIPDIEADDELDELPFWAVRKAAVVYGVCEYRDFVEREGEDGGTYLGFADAETYNATLEALEEHDIAHNREQAGEKPPKSPVSALPLERLRGLDPSEARRYARKQGVEWPTTRKAREELRGEILRSMRAGQKVVLDAPTALGKSHTVATERWLNRADHTGEQPVIHLHETKEARDDIAEQSPHGYKLLGRSEACEVAAGIHDPDGDNDDVVTIEGEAASDWFDAMCEGRGIPFSVAHKYLEQHNDQGLEALPCSPGDAECRSITHWDGVPWNENGEPAFDVIHATHQFAHVPSLRMGTNIVFDERPDFTVELSKERVSRVVTAFLKEVDADVETFERLIEVGKHGLSPNEHDPRSLSVRYDVLWEQLQTEPPREWYLENRHAHTLAPALARAIFAAKEQGNGRYAGRVSHEPPRLDARAEDDDGWNVVHVSVVFDEDNDIRQIRSTPDLTTARSVIGLDAHPNELLWQQNVDEELDVEPVLEPEERQLWRYFERGLAVIQVGEATRPYSSGKYFDEQGTRAVVEHLRERYGDDIRTAITASSVEDRTRDILADVDVEDPGTMHFGEEKSRNDFGDETVGLVNGCIDPGDDYVLDLLAEAGLEAEPETRETDDGEEYRAHGRGFVGPDADAAAALLGSVREQHVAQAAGRYARNAEDPEDRAVVFVRTDAMPAGFADLQVPGVEWLATERQREIVRQLRNQRRATAAELADAAGVSKEHVRTTLSLLVERGLVDVRECTAEHGADVYRALTGAMTAQTGVVNLTSDKIANGAVLDPYTWSLAVCSPGQLVPELNHESGPIGAGCGASDPAEQVTLQSYPPG